MPFLAAVHFGKTRLVRHGVYNWPMSKCWGIRTAETDSFSFRSKLPHWGHVTTSLEAIEAGSSANACVWRLMMRQQSHRRPPNITSARGRERAEIGRIRRPTVHNRG